MAKYEIEYSEYEIHKSAVCFDGDERPNSVGSVGTLEEELETTTVTKKSEGRLVKSRTKGSGAGTLKVTLHIKNSIYMKMQAMEDEDLAEGVYAYGTKRKHPVFSYVAQVEDEDGVEKLIAYPKCSLTTGPTSKIENGAEEVAEREVEIALFADENGNTKYEVMVSELAEDSQIANNWFTKPFSYENVKKSVSIGG